MSGAEVVLVAGIGLILSGFFSGAETGFMSVSRVRLQRVADPEAPRVKRLLAQLHDIEDPVLTCLVGTNLANVTFTAVVTAALATRYPGSGEWLSVLVSSVVVILFGEIVPKVLFREFPERLTLAVAPWISGVSIVLTPVRWALLGYTALWRRLLPAEADAGQRLDRRSLAALLLTNTAPNEDDQRFSEILDRFLHLAGLSLKHIMLPLARVTGVGPETTISGCLAVAAQSGFSRLPIIQGNGKPLEAFVLVRDLLFLPRADHDQIVPRHLWRPFLLVDERMSPYELFEEMRGQSRQFALVVDPTGHPRGVLTLEDLIESVVGSVRDEFDGDENELESGGASVRHPRRR